MQFNRGDRVRRVDTPGTIMGLPWNGQTGTVTHLPGDPSDEENPDGFSPEPGFVWVTWDHPRIADQWVVNEQVERITQ